MVVSVGNETVTLERAASVFELGRSAAEFLSMIVGVETETVTHIVPRAAASFEVHLKFCQLIYLHCVQVNSLLLYTLKTQRHTSAAAVNF